ncbi:MAG: integration host factor subunit beta [Candidatus Liberibacter ctenarytainae]|uniref:Integration host factor subunit beta n=1 Tax=Candidatus Liberibacter ctenarytainae TaxID=2020335 RepID=A0A937AJ59_9HYPH|nr:integration host factor subunit beta [Candidatus Liberibacter ctenarytainae]
MIKSSLIDSIAKRNPHISHKDIVKMVNTLLEEMTLALAMGKRVEIRGFGIFSVRKRPARLGRSPHTREVISIKEKWIPFFKSGKNLKERLNLVDNAMSKSEG